jgi:hypothetical protein
LGLEHDRQGAEHYLRLDPAVGSEGIYGGDATVQDFLASQGIEAYLQMHRRYASLLQIFRERIAEVDEFDIVEPREFWRGAVREALAETNFDPNPIIDALYDPDRLGCRPDSETEFVAGHVREIERRIRDEHDLAMLAAAAVLLAVSLGYLPSVFAQARES